MILKTMRDFWKNDHDQPGLTVTRSGLTRGRLIWAAHLRSDGGWLLVAVVSPETGGARWRRAPQLTGDARTRAPGLGFRWEQRENEANKERKLTEGLKRRETRRRRRSGRWLAAAGGAPAVAALCE
jgi:hypothetical protein